VVPFDHFRDAPPERVQFMPVDELPRLAFNHNEIIRRGVERVRSKASYSSLPAARATVSRTVIVGKARSTPAGVEAEAQEAGDV
jgi:hypothetical protein